MLGLLTQTCTIRRNTPSGTNAHGRPTAVWADLATGVACRIEAIYGDEQTGPVQPTDVTHTLYLQYGQDIDEADRVVIDGTTYETVFVDADVAGAGHHVEARLKEVRL